MTESQKPSDRAEVEPIKDRVSRRTGRQQLYSALLGTTIAAFCSTHLLHADTPCDAYVAEDCDCVNSSCDQTRPADCVCGKCSHEDRLMENPIYRSLDAVAGGIEKVLGLDKCGKSRCNSGCDSCGCCNSHGQPYSPSMPPGPVLPESSLPLAPTPAPMLSQPSLPSVPPLDPAPLMEPSVGDSEILDSEPMAPPKIEPRISEPRIVEPSLPSTPPSDLDVMPQPEVTELDPMPADPIPFDNKNDITEPEFAEPDVLDLQPKQTPPMEEVPNIFETDSFESTPESMPETEENDSTEESSIFDALDAENPFLNGEVSAPLPYGSVRTTYRRQPMQPTQRNQRLDRNASQPPALSSPQPAHLQQRPQQPVGSGLRPVSHQEPVQLKPFGERRILAPYRPSR